MATVMLCERGDHRNPEWPYADSVPEYLRWYMSG
jgi:hypothetical protein